MVTGSLRSRSQKRANRRIPSGKSVVVYRRKRAGMPTCPTGRPLPGTARGCMTEVRNMTKTARRPSRPYGGVLSSPALRDVMRERATADFTAPKKGVATSFAVGTVCIKIAGRDAGQRCVVVEKLDAHFVKVDGFTRPRKCSTKHLEPTGKVVDVKKGASSKDIQAMLD